MFKNLFRKIKSLFVEEKRVNPVYNTQQYKDLRTGNIVNSALTKTINNKRFLQLDNNTCALIIHPNYVFEAVLTKYNEDNQNFTEEEILLLSLVIHLKQEGFSEMLVSELHRIAMKNDSLFNKYKENENK